MTGWTGARAVPGAAIVAGTLLVSYAATGRAAPNDSADGVPKRTSYEYGEALFFHETFEGNGRTCATCHDPRNEFTVSPDLVQQRYRLDPSHPLFRPVDSDDGRGSDYTTVLTHAVFRVTIPLHPNVTQVEAPNRRTITVWRGVPSIANVDLTAPYLQDGRAATLQEQALGAIRDHMVPVHKPTAKELDALAEFEREFYYPLRLRSIDDTSDPLPKAAGFSLPISSPAAQRGKVSFDLRCSRCHDGELGDRPTDPARSRFANVFVSDANRLEFPLLRLAFRQPDGTTIETVSPDPGRAAITGDLKDLNAFDTPSLRGLKHTAPYFHDNSAKTLEEMIEHYDDHFQFRMSSREREDLLAFLELL